MRKLKPAGQYLAAFLLIMSVGVSCSEAKAEPIEFGDLEETTFWDDWEVIKQKVIYSAETSVTEVKPKMAVYGGAWSRHVGSNRHGKNEVHELAAFEYDGYLVGHMKNSFNDPVWLVGKDWNVWSNRYIGVGVIGLLTYGYEKETMDKFSSLNFNKFVPVAVPYVELTYFLDNYGVNPRIGPFGNAITLTLRYEF